MDPLLVITNSDAGTCRRRGAGRPPSPCCAQRASVEVQATGDAGRARRRAAPGRVPADRGRRRRRQPARGGRRAATARHDLEPRRARAAPARHRQRLRPRRRASRSTSRTPPRCCWTAPSGPMDLIVDEVGEIVVNNVHVGAGAQASRAGDRWKERLGSIGVGKVNLGKLGYPIGAAIDRREARRSSGCGSRSTARSSTTSTEPVLMVAVGNGSYGRRRHRADAGRRPRRRPGRRDDLPRRSGRSPGCGTPCALGFATGTPSATTCSTCAGRTVSVSGERVLVQRRRRDLRPGAAPHLARRAGGVLDGAAWNRDVAPQGSPGSPIDWVTRAADEAIRHAGRGQRGHGLLRDQPVRSGPPRQPARGAHRALRGRRDRAPRRARAAPARVGRLRPLPQGAGRRRPVVRPSTSGGRCRRCPTRPGSTRAGPSASRRRCSRRSPRWACELEAGRARPSGTPPATTASRC